MTPEGFISFQFTKDVALSFASYQNGRLEWEESVRYVQDSVHVFSYDIDAYGSLNLVTPDGRRIPGVPSHLLRVVNASPAPKPSKRVVEAFPAPVPGVAELHEKVWSCPYNFDSLRVVRDGNVPSSVLDCPETPLAYLYLVEGDGRRYDKLYYRCSYFGVPSGRKLAKV